MCAGTARVVCCCREFQLILTSVVVRLCCLRVWVFYCLDTLAPTLVWASCLPSDCGHAYFTELCEVSMIFSSRHLVLWPDCECETIQLSIMTELCRHVIYSNTVLCGSAPRYIAACCVSVSTTAFRQHLRSAAGHQLVIPSHRFTTYGRRAFSVAGQMFWNSLPRNLRDPSYIAAIFGQSL